MRTAVFPGDRRTSTAKLSSLRAAPDGAIAAGHEASTSSDPDVAGWLPGRRGTPGDVPGSMKDAFTDLVDRAHGGHAEQQALLVVVVEQRTGRADKHLEAVADGLSVVVGPPPPGQPMQ